MLTWSEKSKRIRIRTHTKGPDQEENLFRLRVTRAVIAFPRSQKNIISRTSAQNGRQSQLNLSTECKVKFETSLTTCT